jgi:hypothetical protein
MKFSITNSFLAMSLLFMGGCGGHAVIKTSEKNANYDQTISNLVVVIDESHLQRAFLQNRRNTPGPIQFDANVPNSAEARMAARNARVDDQLLAQKKFDDSLNAPMIALKESFISAFAMRGVGAEVEVVNIVRDRLAVAKIARKNGPKQILILNTAAFQTSQATLYGKPYGPSHWTGRVSWDARLFDGDKAANPEGKPVWNAKTDFFLFGPAECSGDAFKTCSDRFVATVVQQMLVEGLLPGEKK